MFAFAGHSGYEPGMKLSVANEGGLIRAAVAGRLDAAGVESAQDDFQAQVVDPGLPAMVDLSGVEFMASMGIAMLVRAAKRLDKAGAVLVLHSAPPMVAEVMAMAGLDRLVSVAPDAAGAEVLARGKE